MMVNYRCRECNSLEKSKLTNQEEALLRFLRQQVDHYQEKSLKTQFKHPNTNQDWDRARRELKDYVSSLRKENKNI